MKFKPLIFILSLIILSDSQLYADNTKTSSAILVLDASGSMWGKIEGQAKIQIARTAIHSILDDWDSSVHLGLIAYGHRKKGDCNDIESLINVNTFNRKKFLNTMNRINPKGKTPLSKAVITAANKLRYKEQKATVILVSDGKETCDMDPCKVGQKLEAAGVDFTAHIIGFDVKDDLAISQLKCLANETGGSFTLANNAKALKKALHNAVKWMHVSLHAPKYVFANTAFNIEWEGPSASDDKIVFVPHDAPEGTLGSYALTSQGSPAKIVAPTGSKPYEVRYVNGKDGKTILKLKVILRGSAASIDAPTQITIGTPFEVNWKGPNADGDRIAIVKKSEKDGYYFGGEFSIATSRGSPSKLTAYTEHGFYEIRYIATNGVKVLARQSIEIIDSDLTLNAPEKIEAGMKFTVKWSGPANPKDHIVLVKKTMPDGRYITGKFSVKTSKDTPTMLVAYTEAGDYEIRYMAGVDGKVLARIPLKIMQSTIAIDVVGKVEAGNTFDVRWSGSAQAGDRIIIMPKSASERSYPNSVFSAFPEKANPVKLTAYSDVGDFEVRYMSNVDGKILDRKILNILPTTIQLQAPAEVQAKAQFEVHIKGKTNDDSRIILVKESTLEGSFFNDSNYSIKVSQHNSVTLQAFAEPGNYEVRYMATGDGKTLSRSKLKIVAD